MKTLDVIRDYLHVLFLAVLFTVLFLLFGDPQEEEND